MQMATSGVEFSFNNAIYRETDGIAMSSSPLGPVFLIFLLAIIRINSFIFQLNHNFTNDIWMKLLSFLKMKPSAKNYWPSWMSRFKKSHNKFITSVYRKPSFSGQYIRWNSFGPSIRKKNLISTLVRRALSNCSRSMLQQELENIKVILRDNSYPESTIDKGISNKLAKLAWFQSSPKFGPNECPVHLKLPWIGNNALKFENKIKSSLKLCFRAVEPRVLFSTRNILPFIYKYAVPSI